MKNADSLRHMLAYDQLTYRIIRNAYKEWLHMLTRLYKRKPYQHPSSLAVILDDAIGSTEAISLIGSIINAAPYEYPDDIRTWAENDRNTYDREAAHMLDLDKPNIPVDMITAIAAELKARQTASRSRKGAGHQ